MFYKSEIYEVVRKLAEGLGQVAHLGPWHIHPQVERAGHLRRLDTNLFQAFMEVVCAGTVMLFDPQALHGLPSCAVKPHMKIQFWNF